MYDFYIPTNVALMLARYPRLWGLCGGWGIDVFLNRYTRQHKDIDIAISRNDQMEMRAYLEKRGYTCARVVAGRAVDWDRDEWLAAPINAIWCSHPYFTPGALEIHLDDVDEHYFHLQYDQTISLETKRAFLIKPGDMHLQAPELILLYKVFLSRSQDTRDFYRILPALDAQRRAWLYAAIACKRPYHEWLSALAQHSR
jgi:Aminoglycoside-2''-adenylyltransferase